MKNTYEETSLKISESSCFKCVYNSGLTVYDHALILVFVLQAALRKTDDTERTVAFHHAIQRLPPPHYR